MARLLPRRIPATGSLRYHSPRRFRQESGAAVNSTGCAQCGQVREAELTALAGRLVYDGRILDLWQQWIRWRIASGLTGTTPIPTRTGNGIGWLRRKPRTYS